MKRSIQMTDADKNEMRILAQRGRLIFKLLISLFQVNSIYIRQMNILETDIIYR